MMQPAGPFSLRTVIALPLKSISRFARARVRAVRNPDRVAIDGIVDRGLDRRVVGGHSRALQPAAP